MRILVVDDDPLIVEILSMSIRLSGHDADEASDGLEAIDRVRSSRYDAVITDANMPRLDGPGLCRFLKAEFPGIPIVGMSGDPYFLRLLEDAGADSCLPKPFGMDELESALERVIGSLPGGAERGKPSPATWTASP